MKKLSEIHIRDPFVLPVPEENLYYLYGTMGEYTWTNAGVGFDCYTSTDLINWEGPFPVFRPDADFWADRSFWAPEVHLYQGKYFLFASFKAEGVCRGTQILKAESPLGPFQPISEKPVTPPDWECLDGTLYVAPDGKPWIIFCHEWVQVGDGEICALPLTEDLTQAAGEPTMLFSASQAPWAEHFTSNNREGYVTDGPWLHHSPNGDLLMLWSSFYEGVYAIGKAHSPTGDILGPWIQEPHPLYSGDGGHCMTFSDFDEYLRVSFHRPNDFPNERPIFVPLDKSTLALLPLNQGV